MNALTFDGASGAPPAPLERRKPRGSGHERRDELLASARALFLEHGVENVSTRQIAARAGISQTCLYVYFASKEELLDRLVEVSLRKLGGALDAVNASFPDPIEYLRANLRAYIRFGLDNPDEYRLAFMLRNARRKGAQAGEGERAIGDALFDVLQSRIAQGVAAGKFHCLASARAAAQSVWAAVHGLVALRLAYPDFAWVAVDEQIDAQVDMLLNGLAQTRAPRGASIERE